MKEYKVDGSVIRIELEDGRKCLVSTDYIEKNMKILGEDMEDTITNWLEDEGYLINDEQEELCIAAKQNKVKIIDEHKVKKERKKTVKENPVKEMIIAEIAKCIGSIDGAEDIVIENKGKIITFVLNDENYKIDLIQKRKKKSE